MASHHKLAFMISFLFLISCVAAAAADPAVVVVQEPRDQTGKSFIASHRPERHNFPNERLYAAYLVIHSFKSSITSDPKKITTTWTGYDICGNYLGFHCSTLPGRAKKLAVTSVLLNGFGLHAPKLQGFIDQLPDLVFFLSASNNFGPGIPRLNSLPFLSNLDEGDGSCQGPTGIGHKCPEISIDGIRFKLKPKQEEGAIIPGFTDAKALILNYNNISGPLPANLGFSKLSHLSLANNRLTGPIPQSIRQAKNTLLEVVLLNNQLSGCLPHELGMLTKTSVIDAGMNQLTGPIPSSFACLTSVEQLNLAGNRLYGEVPDALCNLAGPAGRLANLTMSSNYFTSVGPACDALIKDGLLHMKQNCIPGFPNQRVLEECASFLSQPKTCPVVSSGVACPPATDKKDPAPPKTSVAREYHSYVTYATLHD
ncbi:hypothetical protein ZWY2020_032881 [Hordeum vulgare]|nr:hypothetical protein ZWY2020_032881 [Hordeum vulgare]